MSRLTVILLASDLRIGSVERPLIELACGLDRERFRVFLAAPDGELYEDELRGCGGVEVASLGRQSSLHPGAVLRLSSLLRRENVDIVQFTRAAASPGLLGAILARTPVKVVTWGCGERLSTHFGDKLRRFFQDRLARFADVVVSSSETGGRDMTSHGTPREKLRVIYDGVSPAGVRTDLAEREELRSDLGILPESWVIGSVANLTPANDHGTFLQAASIVRAEAPGTKFLLVGEGPLRHELQRRASLLGLDGSVIFAGYRPRAAPYIGAMDVAVMPSKEQDGPPTFLLEAMGLGRSIVATDVGANGELCPSGEAGLLVPPENPLILAHAVLETMRHPDAADRMRKRGREIFRERFTLSRMVTAYEDMYEDLWRRYGARRDSRTGAASPAERP